jgi:hypothetical protein
VVGNADRSRAEIGRQNRRIAERVWSGAGLSLTLQTSRNHEIASSVNCAFSIRGIRIGSLYAFDPRRTAILLIGGDKTGDDRWYETNIPIADQLYDRYLEEWEEPDEDQKIQ